MKVFFIPFAGGSKYSYSGFLPFLQFNDLKCHPIDFPGRGARFREPLLENIELLVSDAVRQIRDEINEPYCIYGHSMGGIVAYLLTHRLAELKLNKPVYLFVSGCGGPSCSRVAERTHLMPPDEFKNKLLEMGGCPEEIIGDSKLFNIFAPILRADFKAIETYVYLKRSPLDIPISVFIGREDNTTNQEALAWQEETSQQVEVLEFEGNHFFIFGMEKAIAKIIAGKTNLKLYI